MRTVFGIPGTHNLEIYRHLAASSIQAVTTRHEQGAGYAADGYAQVARRPGVVVTTTGPGTLKCGHGCRYVVRGVPPGAAHLLRSSTRGERPRPRRAARHEGRPGRDVVPHRVERPTSDSRGSRRRHHAGIHPVRDRTPRPVYIEIPLDVLEAEWRGTADNPVRYREPHPGRRRRARPGRCAAAAQPAAGDDPRRRLSRRSGEVRDLAERLNAIVVTTCNGKGVLPETHPLSAGASVRLRGGPALSRRRDALLVIGSELRDADLWGAPAEQERDPRRHRSPQLHKGVSAAVPLLGDARSVVGELAKRVDARPFDQHEPTSRQPFAPRRRRRHCIDGAEWRAAQHTPCKRRCPRRDRRGGLVAGHLSRHHHFFAAERARERALYAAQRDARLCVPAAIGAKLAAPRPTSRRTARRRRADVLGTGAGHGCRTAPRLSPSWS